MGNEHFWQVPRAKGVRTQHHAECTARKQLVGALPADDQGGPAHARNRISGITEVGDIHTLRVDDVLLMIFLGEGQEL